MLSQRLKLVRLAEATDFLVKNMKTIYTKQFLILLLASLESRLAGVTNYFSANWFELLRIRTTLISKTAFFQGANKYSSMIDERFGTIIKPIITTITNKVANKYSVITQNLSPHYRKENVDFPWSLPKIRSWLLHLYIEFHWFQNTNYTTFEKKYCWENISMEK